MNESHCALRCGNVCGQRRIQTVETSAASAVACIIGTGCCSACHWLGRFPRVLLAYVRCGMLRAPEDWDCDWDCDCGCGWGRETRQLTAKVAFLEISEQSTDYLTRRGYTKHTIYTYGCAFAALALFAPCRNLSKFLKDGQNCFQTHCDGTSRLATSHGVEQ